jgi:hypothetical protein
MIAWFRACPLEHALTLPLSPLARGEELVPLSLAPLAGRGPG